MRTAVIILNWNTKGYLETFLPSLAGSLPEEDGLFVADSGSTDGSLEAVKSSFPLVGTIPLGENYGFTGGYNRAVAAVLKEYSPKFVLLLNSDVDVGKGWLEPLEKWMESNPDCAACAPKLHALVPDGKGGWKRTDRFEYAGAAGGFLTPHGFPYCRGRIFRRTSRDRGQFDGRSPFVKWASGACLMVRSSVWERLGGLDSRFFAHMEEIDFCWRARREGLKVAVVPQSVVWHIGGGTLAPASPLKMKLNFRNSLLMLSNNLPKGSRLIRERLAMDALIRLLFLAAGRKEMAEAVREAHKEYREYENSH